MEITSGLRDLLTETAESLSGAERRRFMVDGRGPHCSIEACTKVFRLTRRRSA